MIISELVSQMKSSYEGFSPAASKEDLKKLEGLIGTLHPDLVALYSTHDGSTNAPGNDEGFLPARLMPISEVLEIQREMQAAKLPQLGNIVWLWNDDAGNLLGLYTTGLFAGWLTKFDHEESFLIPAYRSIQSFMKAMLENARFPDEDARACDLVGLDRDVPAVHMDDPIFVANDKKLREQCIELADKTTDENVRMLYVMSIIALTPASETESLTDFFEVDHDCIPEAAVKLMDIREYYDAIPAVEKLAKEGDGNAVAAATRMLVRAENEKAKEAVERLKSSLRGANLQWLHQWLEGRNLLRAPRWD
jgi:hypothetical protein